MGGFILLNVIAYQHAKAMLNFTGQIPRTESIEVLSIWQKLTILLTGVKIPKPLNTITSEAYATASA